MSMSSEEIELLGKINKTIAEAFAMIRIIFESMPEDQFRRAEKRSFERTGCPLLDYQNARIRD